MGDAERLEAARSFAAAGRWEQARAEYAAAAAAGGTAEAYDGLGRVCWWLGDVRSAIRHRERAFTCYREEARTDDAAMVAVDIGIWYLTNLDNDAAAQGWLARAARCAEDTQNDALRGWVILVGAHLSGDPQELAAGIEQARSLARIVGDTALETMALADLGLLLVTAGDVDQGMRLLDEAMAATLGGLGERLEVVVWSSCNMLAACSLVDDLRRAIQWCRAADTFMETYGCPFLQARCRAHYGRVLVSSGDWALAEAELKRALAMAEEVGRGPRADARTALAELRLRQGRAVEAAALLADLDGTSATATVTRAGSDVARGHPDLRIPGRARRTTARPRCLVLGVGGDVDGRPHSPGVVVLRHQRSPARVVMRTTVWRCMSGRDRRTGLQRASASRSAHQIPCGRLLDSRCAARVTRVGSRLPGSHEWPRSITLGCDEVHRGTAHDADDDVRGHPAALEECRAVSAYRAGRGARGRPRLLPDAGTGSTRRAERSRLGVSRERPHRPRGPRERRPLNDLDPAVKGRGRRDERAELVDGSRGLVEHLGADNVRKTGSDECLGEVVGGAALVAADERLPDRGVGGEDVPQALGQR